MQRVLRRLTDHLGRWILAIAFLVSDAYIALHAIAVTIWRLQSGRRRLEWTSAAHMATRNAARHPRFAAWRAMWSSPPIGRAESGEREGQYVVNSEVA